MHKYGIIATDNKGKVNLFLEKPEPFETTSRKQCPCFYFFNRKSIGLIQEFIQDNKDEPLKARDAPGNFIAYLYKRKPVYATEISGRFDVGSLQSYIKCNEYFLKLHKKEFL